MKKYLIKGALALFAGAFLFSCAEKESEYVPVAQMKVKAFDEVFKEIYGDIDPYQDWGFNSGKTHLDPTDESIFVDMVDADEGRAFTRTVAFTGANSVLAFQSRTRYADPRGNMWADEGWNVPPVITDAQKDIVRRYFQQNTPLGYNNPGWSNFWIQQVYKGGTKTTDGSQTTEKYTIGNSSEVTGGDHMDHLCSKSANGTEDHVNDFNNSDNNDWEGRMLMRESSTYSFGYINSNATAIHYDKAALVNWRVIAKWAVDNGLESSVEASVLNDGWNRSYMGFDWEQALPEDCYAKGAMVNGVWDGDAPATFDFEGKTYRFLIANSNQYAYDTTEPTYGGIKKFNDVKEVTDDVMRDLLSKGYLPYSDTKKDWIKLSTGADGYYSDWIVTLTEAKWTDPTYEDFEEEEEEKWTTVDEGRVFCEDLGRASREDLDYNDVVFDAKIWRRDYYYKKIKKTYENKTKQNMIGNPEPVGTPVHDIDYYAQITLLAAGGTIPVEIKVAGLEFPVHDQFGEDTPIDMMVNTRDENSTAYGNYGSREEVQLHGKDVMVRVFKLKKVGQDVTYEYQNPEYKLNLIPLGSRSSDPSILEDIEIYSSYDGGTYAGELTSKLGESPQKFMAPTTTNWTSERKNISLAYPDFNAWVTKKINGEPWGNSNPYYLYSGSTVSSSSQQPRAIRVQRNHTLEGQYIIWQPTQEDIDAGRNAFGYSGSENTALEAWSLKRLSVDLSNVGFFSAGDRIRFYASGMPTGNTDADKTWITVVINSVTPYFVDCEFPNYEFVGGEKVATSDGCLEVVLDANAANLMNSAADNGHLLIEVQGRNFTLDRICKVE
jgi:hypothetical protein